MPRYYKNCLIFPPEKVLEMRKLVDEQSKVSSKSAYALRKQDEKIQYIVDKKLKKRKNIR